MITTLHAPRSHATSHTLAPENLRPSCLRGKRQSQRTGVLLFPVSTSQTQALATQHSVVVYFAPESSFAPSPAHDALTERPCHNKAGSTLLWSIPNWVLPGQANTCDAEVRGWWSLLGGEASGGACAEPTLLQRVCPSLSCSLRQTLASESTTSSHLFAHHTCPDPTQAARLRVKFPHLAQRAGYCVRGQCCARGRPSRGPFSRTSAAAPHPSRMAHRTGALDPRGQPSLSRGDEPCTAVFRAPSV